MGQSIKHTDFPALKMQDVANLTIGTGTPALSFASEATDLGPDQELWFTRNGYLIEITTYPNLAAWLAQIVQTIRFP